MSHHTIVRDMLREMVTTPPCVEEGILEALADNAHEARLGDGAAGLAAGQGLTLARCLDLPWGLGGFAVDAILVVQGRRDPSVEYLVALHELAHLMLTNLDHTHGDVWCLALALGAPARVARLHRDSVALALASGLPVPAAERRLRILSRAA